MAVTFEGYERREAKTSAIMKQYGIKDFDDALKICTDKGFNPYKITEGIQNICFENAKCRRRSRNRRRTAGVLHPRICRRAEKSRTRTR